MEPLAEIEGVDVSDYSAIKLSKAAFANVDFNLYTPLRAHFVVHAIQTQSKLPS
jgi:hypothetical protein